jgi:hypothetical protein
MYDIRDSMRYSLYCGVVSIVCIVVSVIVDNLRSEIDSSDSGVCERCMV